MERVTVCVRRLSKYDSHKVQYKAIRHRDPKVPQQPRWSNLFTRKDYLHRVAVDKVKAELKRRGIRDFDVADL